MIECHDILVWCCVLIYFWLVMQSPVLEILYNSKLVTLFFIIHHEPWSRNTYSKLFLVMSCLFQAISCYELDHNLAIILSLALRFKHFHSVKIFIIFDVFKHLTVSISGQWVNFPYLLPAESCPVMSDDWQIDQSIAIYRKISNMRCTKIENLNVSHIGLQLSMRNILKPSLKWRMKM